MEIFKIFYLTKLRNSTDTKPAAIKILLFVFALLLSSLYPSAPVFSMSSLHGFILTGDPESAAGATWTYQDTISSVIYDMSGILFKPQGAGIFPGVIISHGFQENVTNYSTAIALKMRSWGLVCIATNYTHATGVPVGSPGNIFQPGASSSNLLRAHKCLDILTSLGYVNMLRIAAHGFSMGAFVTAAFAGVYPGVLLVASHTAGGVNNSKLGWTTVTQANGITIPYQIHHGDNDAVVALNDDKKLDTILRSHNVIDTLYIYPGYGHSQIAYDSLMLMRVRAWYISHGLFTQTLNLTMFIQGFYNAGSDTMIRDTLRVYLRNNYSPYAIVDSSRSYLSANGNGIFNFFNAISGINYYLQLKHRNSIETWSRAPGQIFSNSVLTYNFSDSAWKAFGNNMLSVDVAPLRFAVYNGDVNQDGLIDLSDIIAIYNDATVFASGYVVTDINGDNFVDVSDLIPAYNNSNNFVGTIRP